MILHVTFVLNCKDHRILTQTQQLNLKRKLQKMYGGVRTTRLQEVEAQLTHELRIQSKILRDKEKIHERQRINSLFNSGAKTMYREFRKDAGVDVVNPSPKETAGYFWTNIWSQPGTFNQEASWLPDLRKKCCRDVETRTQDIKIEHFNQITDKLKDGNSPGRDLVVGY